MNVLESLAPRGLWGLLLATAVVACEATTAPPPAPITATAPRLPLRIGLTSSAASLQPLVSESYTRGPDQAPIQFTLASNETLLADLKGGYLDAALVHHLPTDGPLWFNPVALDGLVVVVHPDNPISVLSPAEVQSLFSGRSSNWSDLDGPDSPVTVIIREPGSGTRYLFDQHIMTEQRISGNAQVASSNQALLEDVASNPGAIGYSMMASMADVKALSLDDVAATTDSTAEQTYPLTQPLYFVSRKEPEGELRELLAWLQSSIGQEVLGEKYGRVR